MTNDIVKRLLAHDQHPESASKQAADTITALRAEVEKLRPTRMCLSCGKTVPASHDRKNPGPDCNSPDACTFDLTHEEAWQWWSKVAHDERDLRIATELERDRLREVMETLRPVWAQGWSTESMAAQASASALAQLWQMLGASNQTEAVTKLRALTTKGDADAG